MEKIIFIAAGGGLGAVLRFVLGGYVQRPADSFPVGTLTVNVTGCFLIGLLATALTGPFLIREEFRLALLIGVLGGFTTFSSFGWETLAMTDDGQFKLALLYVALSNIGGLAAVWVGARLAIRLFGV